MDGPAGGIGIPVLRCPEQAQVTLETVGAVALMSARTLA